MGVVFKESGDYPDALKAFNFAIEGAPNMWQAYSNRSSTYAEMGQYDSALQDADKVIELKPDVPNGYGLWCWIAGDKNADLDKALLDCNQAVDLQVKSAELLNTRGFIYFRMSNFPAAIADYTSALAIKPKFAASLYMRGITRLKMADSVNGNDDIAAAKALQPDIGEQYAKLGVTP
jgi:tetratricopeptide (TPR) repeat protein